MSTHYASRRPRRPLRALLITVVVLLALLAGADRAILYIAESKIADELQTRFGTNGSPEVSIDGFPLLTQALAGSYRRVRIDAAGVDAQNLQEVDVHLDLRDVQIPIKDVVAGELSGGRIGQAHAAIDISSSSLSTLTGLPIKIEGLTSDVARLSTTVEVLGKAVPVSVDARVVIEGVFARLDLQGASAAGIDLPGLVVSKLSDIIGVQFAVPTLVDGMHLDSVSARDGLVVLHASGSNVPFPTG